MKIYAICLLGFFILICGVFFYGWKSGYNASEKEYLEKVVELTQESRAYSNKVAELIRKEKQLLQEIKNDKLECKEVLNFDLRSCFTK